MNTPNDFNDDPFDAALAGMFQDAAAAVPDDGFSDRVVARVSGRAKLRAMMLSAAAGVGAIAAATQLGPAWRMVAAQYEALAGSIPSEDEAAASLSAAASQAGMDWSALAVSPAVLGAAMLLAMLGLWAAGAATSAGQR